MTHEREKSDSVVVATKPTNNVERSAAESVERRTETKGNAAVIDVSQSSWLVAGIVPGVERQPLKKIAIDEHALLKLLSRWREEAEKKGHKITRVTVTFEAGQNRLRSPLSTVPAGIASRRFRDAHHHGFWPQQLAVAWDQLLIAEPKGPSFISRTVAHRQYS